MSRDLVAVPVYNEEPHIEKVFARIRAYYAGDILAVNDGSTDRSAELLRQIPGVALIDHPRNSGYGSSLIDAFAYALERGYGRLVTIDCDEQHEPCRIPSLFDCLDASGVDICSCSRYMEEEKGNDAPPPDRFSINMDMTAIINGITGWALTDTFCGMKAYRVAALAPLRLTETGYAFPMQFWVQAFHFGLTAKEVPLARIYKNLDRKFGGGLDDPGQRRAHYKDVLGRELARWGLAVPATL